MGIVIHSPEGRVGAAPTVLAASPDVIAGRRLLVLDNGKPGAALLMEALAERLGARCGARVAGALRKGSAATPCEDALLDEIVERADLVLTGTAD
jgi:hypothetical protein